ncbi:MAG: hypothetical protein M0Z95_04435 [Actinomycetota bacterium]|nr:hypothetical protein [Actinomycetota bacterium]
MTPPTYGNEDGDWWVRVDHCPDPDEAEAAVRYAAEWPVTLVGIEVVYLSECEPGCPGRRTRAHPDHVTGGRRRRAWHFTDNMEADR